MKYLGIFVVCSFIVMAIYAAILWERPGWDDYDDYDDYE